MSITLSQNATTCFLQLFENKIVLCYSDVTIASITSNTDIQPDKMFPSTSVLHVSIFLFYGSLLVYYNVCTFQA